MKRQFRKLGLLQSSENFNQIQVSGEQPSANVQPDTSSTIPNEIQAPSSHITTSASHYNAIPATYDIHSSEKGDSLIEQDTVKLTGIHQATFANRILDRLPGGLQRLITFLFVKVRDPEPEGWSTTLRLKAVNSQSRVLGWFPILTLTYALGIFLAAYACAASLNTSTDQENYLWISLILIFVPSFLRILSPVVSRLERISIICGVGLSLYIEKIVLSPLRFFFWDEYLHWRTVDDITRSGHLFTQNTLLPVSPVYPGLEIVTNALSTLSGLSPFTAGLIVVGMTRIVLMLSLFMLYEQISNSARMAGIATMLYMVNARFFLFDSLFIYETLALTIGVFILFALTRIETTGNGKRGLLLTAWLAMGALVMTHHVTDFFFVGLLVLWTITGKFLHLPLLRSKVAKTALLGLLLSAAWVIFIATPVVGYLSSSINEALSGLFSVLTGANNARHLFTDYTSGHPTPVWQRLTMLSSIGFIVLSLPFGFLCVWHRYRYNALALVFGLVSLIYPLTLAFRLTSSGGAVADRFDPYIFISVGFVLAILITQMWPTRRLKWKTSVLISSVVSLVFLGGALLGGGPSWTLMPGSYVVGDDARSIGPEGIQAALWTLSHLGPNNRISTDRENNVLMSTYGDQYLVSLLEDKVDVTPVFYSTHFDAGDVAILQSAQVQYLVVDLRLSTALPYIGFYYESVDSASNTPISRQALTKFDTVPQINREFDSGDIVIYDVGGFLNAQEKH